MYRIERQDQLYKTLPHALFFSPTIVIFSAPTILLPISGIFAPGSLSVTTINSTAVSHCIIPTGNLSTPDSPAILHRFTTWAACKVGKASRKGPQRSLRNGSSSSAFQICLKHAGKTAAIMYPSPPSSFSAQKTHHRCYTPNRTTFSPPLFGRGRRIPIRSGGVT